MAYGGESGMGNGWKIKSYIEKIKEAHFKNQEEERRLCEELITYSQANHNAYGLGFAYTYLLDYHIAMHDTEGCSPVLKRRWNFITAMSFWICGCRCLTLQGFTTAISMTILRRSIIS